MTEREFLIKLAIDAYNSKYNKSFPYIDFDIYSIEPPTGHRLGYEVYSVRTDDFLRIRVYYQFSNIDKINYHKLEVDSNDFDNQLGNEVYIATGTIDRYWKDSRTYLFGWLERDFNRWDILLTEDNHMFLTEDGEPILLEEAEG